jgi:hypothetical protein
MYWKGKAEKQGCHQSRIDQRAIFFYYWWGGTKSTRYCGHFWPIVQAPDDRWGWLWSSWWNEHWQGKPKYSEKTCPSATLSTTNPAWPNLGSNLGRRGESQRLTAWAMARPDQRAILALVFETLIWNKYCCSLLLSLWSVRWKSQAFTCSQFMRFSCWDLNLEV